MQTLVTAMRMMIGIGLMISLSGCLKAGIDDAAGLKALTGPMVAHGEQVRVVDNPELTKTFRALAATWEAALDL